MNTYIALFRGINVGGKNIIKMKELVHLLEGLGLTQVRTYIQSGNVIFESESDVQRLNEKINQAILQHFGFTPQLLMLTFDEFETAIQNNPFSQAQSEPNTLHLEFLAYEPQNPRLTDLELLKSSMEEFRLKGKVFYLYAPEGVGRSKLAANSEKLLGVPITDRNWNTVMKIFEMANSKENK